MEDHFKEKFSDEEMASLVLPAEYLQMAGLHTIKVDITVFYYNQTIPENGGIRTSNFISECLKEYPAMRKLVLLLKWIIAAWDMNKIYTGKQRLMDSRTQLLLYKPVGALLLTAHGDKRPPQPS